MNAEEREDEEGNARLREGRKGMKGSKGKVSRKGKVKGG